MDRFSVADDFADSSNAFKLIAPGDLDCQSQQSGKWKLK
jgi:hypothetical protein